MLHHELYMFRCIELAKLGAGHVAPNPMVGAVLVYNDRIIGEGYHRKYGEAHAEVNCINSVQASDRQFIPSSTIYVSLEPCAHYGKTPPCADLLIEHRIPRVVVGCRDPFEMVNGKGIEKLQAAGTSVICGVLEKECGELNKRFFTFHRKRRPYIVLKWAQSKNHRIANADYSRVLISNEHTNRQVHKWRSEEQSIMVGTNTALQDDPSLNARHWTGPDPVRLIVDLNLRLPQTLQVFNGRQPTVIFNAIKHQEDKNVFYYKLNAEQPLVKQLLDACYDLKLISVLVEGGNRLAETFINDMMWDEARVIENTDKIITNGLRAPLLNNQALVSNEVLGNDVISFYKNDHLRDRTETPC